MGKKGEDGDGKEEEKWERKDKTEMGRKMRNGRERRRWRWEGRFEKGEKS